MYIIKYNVYNLYQLAQIAAIITRPCQNCQITYCLSLGEGERVHQCLTGFGTITLNALKLRSFSHN